MEPQSENNLLNTKQPATANNNYALIPAAIVFAGLMIAGAILYGNGAISPRIAIDDTKTLAGSPQKISSATAAKNLEDDDPVLGNPDAPVVLVEFSDFQCPFCRKFWRESIIPLKEKYVKTGLVRIVYRDFPLDAIHPGAKPAALAAECADDQGKFWEMHDKIFAEQDKIGPGTVPFGSAELKAWARDIGLNMPVFNSCFDGNTHAGEIEKDYAAGIDFGVSGTPHIFVNGKLLIRGAEPFSSVERLIQQELENK